jgi:hypothetical protein
MPILHKVKAGEGTTKLAVTHGHFPETLWSLPENAALRQRREHKDILLPGDVLHIPDRRVALTTVSTDARHRFRRKGIPARFSLQLVVDGRPLVNQPYRFSVDGALHRGITDKSGTLNLLLPAKAAKGELFIGDDPHPLQIRFGHLDPIEEVIGVQKRLLNLGFFTGEPGGVVDELTREALRNFQAAAKLPVSGEIDQATTSKLRDMHDTANHSQDIKR